MCEYYHLAMPTLHVVATPIGNLQDISPRALSVLSSVEVIAAEDTRVTRKLLARHGISVRLVSYHEGSPPSRLADLVRTLESGDIALVCDAGTPGISDAGRELVRAAVSEGATVASVPGPSAVTAAVSVSGLVGGGFVFLGFLPRTRKARQALLKDRDSERLPLVALESPRRLRASLGDILSVLGDREVAVCREMTKMHEEMFLGPVSDAIDHFEVPRGEVTLVVAGARGEVRRDGSGEDRARELLGRLVDEGVSGRDAAVQVAAATGISKRRAYELLRG